MKVREAMHRGVEWVAPDTPVTELAKLMRTHRMRQERIGPSPLRRVKRAVSAEATSVCDRSIMHSNFASSNSASTVHARSSRR